MVPALVVVASLLEQRNCTERHFNLFSTAEKLKGTLNGFIFVKNNFVITTND